MIKGILFAVFALLALALISIIGFFFFPWITHVTYGYKTIEHQENGIHWEIKMITSMHRKRIDLIEQKGPYIASVRVKTNQNCKFHIEEFKISNSKGVVYKYNERQSCNSEENPMNHFIFEGIDIEYLDYDLVITYSIQLEDETITKLLEIPLDRNYLRKRHNLYSFY